MAAFVWRGTSRLAVLSSPVPGEIRTEFRFSEMWDARLNLSRTTQSKPSEGSSPVWPYIICLLYTTEHPVQTLLWILLLPLKQCWCPSVQILCLRRTEDCTWECSCQLEHPASLSEPAPWCQGELVLYCCPDPLSGKQQCCEDIPLLPAACPTSTPEITKKLKGGYKTSEKFFQLNVITFPF